MSLSWKHYQLRTTLKCNYSLVLYKQVCTYKFSGGISHLHSTPLLGEESFPSAWPGSFLAHLYTKTLALGVPTLCMSLQLGMLPGQDLGLMSCAPHSRQPSKENLHISRVQKTSEQKPALVLVCHPGFLLSHCCLGICRFLNFIVIQQFIFKILLLNFSCFDFRMSILTC